MQVPLDDYVWASAVATELVNTSPGVWSGVDKLPDAAAIIELLRTHGLPSVPVLPGGVGAVHALRERVRAVVEDPTPEHLVTGASALTTAVGGLTVAGADGRGWAAVLRDDAEAATVLGLVCGVGILGVLRHLGPHRFRPCVAEDCSGAFIDSTRPGRRRYCMPGVCGNRVNVANHRARRRGAAGSAPP